MAVASGRRLSSYPMPSPLPPFCRQRRSPSNVARWVTLNPRRTNPRGESYCDPSYRAPRGFLPVDRRPLWSVKSRFRQDSLPRGRSERNALTRFSLPCGQQFGKEDTRTFRGAGVCRTGTCLCVRRNIPYRCGNRASGLGWVQSISKWSDYLVRVCPGRDSQGHH